MVNPKLNIIYEVFEQSYLKNCSLLENSYYIRINSLKQLTLLKDELYLLKDDVEAIILLKQIEQIEKTVEMHKENLQYKNIN